MRQSQSRQRLHKLTSRFSGKGPESAHDYLRELLRLLDWQSSSTKEREENFDGSQTLLIRTFLADEPAVVLCASNTPTVEGLVDDVARYGYHTAAEWGLVTNCQETIVFSARWGSGEYFYRLPSVAPDEVASSQSVVADLSPDGLFTGRVERNAFELQRPDRQIVPVDDALVDRLDYWREETLRYTRVPDNIDYRLQTLFAQLFVLRTVEDRGLMPQIPPLHEVGVEGDRKKLSSILRLAKRHIQSELFNEDAARGVPTFVLSGIIEDLYRAHDLPGRPRYNFTWLEADVLGRAYEKYLGLVMVPVKLRSPQGTLWDQPQRDVERVSRRKAAGVFYTPSFLVSYLTASAMDKWLAGKAGQVDELPTIVDPSCGSGAFLVSALDYINRSFKTPEVPHPARKLVSEGRLVGIDVDERAVTLSKLAIWLKLAEGPDPLPLPQLSNRIKTGDSLSERAWEGLPKSFSLFLGNPPFLAQPKIANASTLPERYVSARGRFDYASLFVELAVRKLEPEGVLGLVVPNRVFKNRDATSLRQLVAEQTSVKVVVDFGSLEVFEGIGAQVGLLLASKTDNSVNRGGLTRVVNAKALPQRFTAAALRSAETSEGDFAQNSFESHNAVPPTSGTAWLLLSTAAKDARSRLENVGEALSDVASIVQGIKTGANDIFIVTTESVSEPLARITNRFNEEGIVESSLLRSVVSGPEIQRFALAEMGNYLLYPYEQGKVLSESDFKARYPFTFEYLKRYEHILGARTSLRNDRAWFELSEKRDIRWLRKPKLLTRDLALRASFAPDLVGDRFLVGGTAVVPGADVLVKPLLCYLNSRLVNWYLTQSTPSFKDDFVKFEPQHVSQLPIPRALLEDSDARESLTQLADRAVIFAALGEDHMQEVEDDIEEVIAGLTGINVRQFS